MSRRMTLNQYLKQYEAKADSPPRRDYKEVDQLAENIKHYLQKDPARLEASLPVRDDKRTLRLPGDSTFPRAQGECLQLIAFLRDQIKSHSEDMSHFAKRGFEAVRDSFRKQFDDMRRRILEMVEKGLKESELQVQQKIRNSSFVPPAFLQVKAKYESILAELVRLEGGLRGPQYKIFITETIHSDFEIKLSQLRDVAQRAKGGFAATSVSLAFDERRLQCISQDIRSLYSMPDPVREGKRERSLLLGNESMHQNRNKLRESMYQKIMDIAF